MVLYFIALYCVIGTGECDGGQAVRLSGRQEDFRERRHRVHTRYNYIIVIFSVQYYCVLLCISVL